MVQLLELPTATAAPELPTLLTTANLRRMGAEEEYARIEGERRAALEAILNSDAPKKLIVAGPGTGKTHTFKAALERAGGGVALTFIRALVRDLRVTLADVAEIVTTFHGFAKYLLHSHPYGVGADFWYCPALPIVFGRDLTLLGLGAVRESDVNSAFQTLDDAEGLITESLRLGDYYNAVGHNDVVYRVTASPRKTATAAKSGTPDAAGRPTRMLPAASACAIFASSASAAANWRSSAPRDHSKTKSSVSAFNSAALPTPKVSPPGKTARFGPTSGSRGVLLLL